MSEDPSEIELMAYVDGQLDPGRRFAVETRLSRRPDLAAQVMGDLSARTGLRLLAQDRAPLPEAMAAQAKISDFMIKSPLWMVIMSNSSGYVNCAAGRGTARSRGRRAASPYQSAPAQAGTAYMRPARRK